MRRVKINRITDEMRIREAIRIGNIPGPGTPWLLGGYPLAMKITTRAKAAKRPLTMKFAFFIQAIP